MENEIALVSNHDDDRDQVERVCTNWFPEWLRDAEAEAASSVLHACEQIEESVVGAGWNVFVELGCRLASHICVSDSLVSSFVHITLEAELNCCRAQH